MKTGTGRVLRLAEIAIVIAVAGCPAAAQCPANWVLASAGQPNVPGDPGLRQNSAGVYDSARHLVVIFGGFAGGVGTYGDTWGWNGTTWSLLSNIGPSARANHAMAFDSARGKIVLFGGNSAQAETWEWDGTAWTQVFPATSPAGRFNHAMAFDSVRNVTVLTGGFSTVRYNDTWEYNGVTWTQRAGTTYGGRNGHGMAFDASRNKMVIFGGFNGTRLGDTWEMDAATGNWSLSPAAGPQGRQYTPLAYDTNQHRITLFGGQTGPGTVITDRQTDTWVYDGTSWTQVGTTGPSPRDQHVTVYDSQNHALVVFGGYQGGSFGGVAPDTWTSKCACYANCDASTTNPVLTANDFQCFLNSFAQGQSYANCDNSTVSPILTANDFQCFLNAYAAGCP